VKCADMKRHMRKRMKKMDAERGLTLLMSAIKNGSFDVFLVVALVPRYNWYSFRISSIDFGVILGLLVNSSYVII
jgi:hypothetical protein